MEKSNSAQYQWPGLASAFTNSPDFSEEELTMKYHYIIGNLNFPPDLIPSGYENVKRQDKRPEVRALEGEEGSGYAIKTYFDWADPKVVKSR